MSFKQRTDFDHVTGSLGAHDVRDSWLGCGTVSASLSSSFFPYLVLPQPTGLSWGSNITISTQLLTIINIFIQDSLTSLFFN